MFRRIASNTLDTTASSAFGTLVNIDRANELFGLHAQELQNLLEMAYRFRVNKTDFRLGDPRHRSELRSIPDSVLALFEQYSFNLDTFTFTDANSVQQGAVMWDHLFYAYSIESTRVYSVFEKLIELYAKGDLEINLDAATQQWLHNTEALWFNNPPAQSTFNLTSFARPDLGSTRRCAYFKMFGFSLPSDTQSGGQAYPFHQPKSANINFRRNFERFCEEVWVGISNKANINSYKPTDDAVIAYNAFEIQKNFLSQRNNGDLTKQEFYFVSMMSWFHLTLEYNSPVIRAFGINEESPAQRLFAMANIVGVPANGLSENLFRLADPMSVLLTLIETGVFNQAPAPIYNDTDLENLMRGIIFNYSQLTGIDLKVRQGQNIASYPVSKGNGIPATLPG